MTKPRSSTSTSTPRTRSSKPTVTLLARQSKSRDERDPATQFLFSGQHAERLGWKVVSKYVEKSTSGGLSLDRRPGLQGTLADIRSKRATRVLVAHRDRLDRNLDVRKAYVNAVEEAGGEVWTPDGRLTFSTATAKLMNTQLGALDENYRDVIREKVAEQKRARLEAGCPVTAVPRLGYVNPGGWSPLAVVEEDRPHVVRAFELAADGKSSGEIVKYLRANGYDDVTHSMVVKLLKNEVYIGNLVWGELRHDGAHEAVVSDRLWRRVRDRRKPCGRNPKSESSRLLARLRVVKCGSCGGAMVGDHKLYRCSNRECDSRASISARTLEEIVLCELGRKITGMKGHSGDVLDPVLAEQEHANEALAKLRRIAKLADDLEGFAEEIREAKSRVERADAAVEDARAVTGATWTLSSIFHGLPEDPDFREEPCFEGMSNEQIRELISTIFVSISVARKDAENPVSVNERVTFTPHETFNVQPTLDAAAADAPVELFREAARPGDVRALREFAASKRSAAV